MLALARPVALLLAGARSTAACRSQAAALVNHLHSGSGPSGLDEEAAAVYELAAAFGAEQLAPRSAEWDRGQQPFPVDVVRHAARLGFAGLFVPQEHGGSASSRSRTLGALIFEGLARGDVPVTAYLTIHNMVGYAISRFGTQQQRDELLPGLVTAEWLAAYCLTEPGSGSDAGSLTTSAERVHGGWRLQGSKAFISGGGLADLYLVMARARGQSESEPSGVTAFLLKAGTPGLSFGPPERKLGWRCQPTASVHLDGVVVPDKDVLGDVGGGMRIALHALDGGRVNIAACSLGGAGAALDYAWRYAAQRQQFGRAIGDFQASQFKLADMATGLEASRALVSAAAAALDVGSPRATLSAAMAKRFATDTCFWVTNDALQLLGGYGYLQDHPLERILRDLRVHSILEGTNEIMRVVIHRQLARLDYLVPASTGS